MMTQSGRIGDGREALEGGKACVHVADSLCHAAAEASTACGAMILQFFFFLRCILYALKQPLK